VAPPFAGLAPPAPVIAPPAPVAIAPPWLTPVPPGPPPVAMAPPEPEGVPALPPASAALRSGDGVSVEELHPTPSIARATPAISKSHIDFPMRGESTPDDAKLVSPNRVLGGAAVIHATVRILGREWPREQSEWGQLRSSFLVPS